MHFTFTLSLRSRWFVTFFDNKYVYSDKLTFSDKDGNKTDIKLGVVE